MGVISAREFTSLPVTEKPASVSARREGSSGHANQIVRRGVLRM